MLRQRSLLPPYAILATLALVVAGCTTGGAASASAGASTVNVTLQEFSVIPDVTTAPAGSITFHITNDGPDDVHEFVVIKTDLAADALPTGDDGSVDEGGGQMEVMGEVEDLTVGDSEDLVLTLPAGSYVLICNIVEAGEVHYELGMRTAFTVE